MSTAFPKAVDFSHLTSSCATVYLPSVKDFLTAAATSVQVGASVLRVDSINVYKAVIESLNFLLLVFMAVVYEVKSAVFTKNWSLVYTTASSAVFWQIAQAYPLSHEISASSPSSLAVSYMVI